MPRRWLFLPANDLFHAAHWFVLRALYLVVGHWILSPLLVTHSIRYALCSSTLLYESRKRNSLPCLPLSSPNKVQCILYKVLWVLKLCQGKTQHFFCFSDRKCTICYGIYGLGHKMTWCFCLEVAIGLLAVTRLE